MRRDSIKRIVKGIVSIVAVLLIVFLQACASPQKDPPTIEEPLITSEDKHLDDYMSEPIANTEATTNTQATQSVETAQSETEEVFYNSYILDLDFDPETRTVTGFQRISYKNKTSDAIDTLYINVPINAFSKNASYDPYLKEHEKKIYQYGKDYATFDIQRLFINNNEVSYTFKDTVLAIHLDEPFESDRVIDIALEFESTIPKISHRTGSNDKAVWFGNFIPTLAVRNNIEVRTDKYYGAGDPFLTTIANYNVTVTTPEGYTVVGTGTSSVMNHNGKQITEMDAQMVRDFAFSISNNYKLSQIEASNGKVIYFYYYSDLENITKLMEMAKNSLEFYSQKIAEYPYKELTIVESELFFSCGMEFSKFIMMDSTYLKTPEAIESLAHEIGHQWFFNVVGNDQIRTAWLDEGLVTFLQKEMLYSAEELEVYMQQYYTRLLKRVENNIDSRLTNDLSVFENWQSYYRSAYTRGMLMLYSIKKTIGDENFTAFIKEYYTKNAFRIAKQEDFTTIAAKYLEDSEEFFQGWINDFELPKLY